MEGDLSLLSIPDLLQMICLGGYSRDIHLFEGQTQVGVIAIRNGRVDRCFGHGTWGEAAFFKLVNMRRGRYKVNEAQDMSASDATLTAYSWQELLMEAARQQDEAARAVQTAAATSGRVIPFPGPLASGSGVSSSFDGAGGVTMLRDSSSSDTLDFSSMLDSGFQAIQLAPSGSSSAGSGSSGSGSSGSGSAAMVSLASVSPAPARSDAPRSPSDTGKQAGIASVPASAEPEVAELAAVAADAPLSAAAEPAAPVALLSAADAAPAIAAPPAPAAAPIAAAAPAPTAPPAAAPAASSPAPASASSDSSADDVMNLLQEATACYLRRDLARAEALLQKCLELRPGDKRALQNLDRIRRKKPQ